MARSHGTTTNQDALKQISRFSRTHLLPRRHTLLLSALVAAFSIRPLIGNVGFGPSAFSFALVVLMLVSLYTVQVDELIGERDTLVVQRRRRARIGWLLAIPAIAERLAITLSPSRAIVMSGLLFWLLFFAYITWNELRAVLRQKEVTGETISLSISIYLLLGMFWGIFYGFLYYAHSHAFSFAGAAPSGQELFPVLLYFSLTTLSTIGFGDITPLTLQARYAAVAEGITGQFYLAILVARLVGLYMSRTSAQDSAQTQLETRRPQS